MARIRYLVLVLVCAVFGFLIYGNTLPGVFQFDDHSNIVNNSVIKDPLNFALLWQAFNTRFLTGISYALNYAAGGLNPTGYHQVNLAIHVINAFLVFCFIELLIRAGVFRGRRPAAGMVGLAAALIFFVHPVQTQAVTYISQRAAILAAMFYLLTLNLYILGSMGKRPWLLGLASCCAVAGMFTKELMFTAPLMLLVLEIYFLKQKEMWRSVALRLAPFFLTLLVIPLVLRMDTSQSLWGLGRQVSGAAFQWDHVWTELNVVRTYLRLLVFPVGQNLDYDFPLSAGFWNLSTVLSAVLVLGLGVTAVAQFSRRRWLSFCIVWFFLTMSVELAVCALVAKDVIFEHYLYLPMAGAALAAARLLSRAARNERQFAALFLVVVFTLGAMTFQRNKVWRDEISLWSDVIKKSPRKARGYVNLGRAFRQQGKSQEALEYYEKSLTLPQPNHTYTAQTHINIAAVYGERGNYPAEIEHCLQAVELDPQNPQAYSNLAIAYLMMKDYGQALSFGEKAVAVNPNFAEGYNNLGVVLGALGRNEEALRSFNRAVRLNPDDFKARENLETANRLIQRRAGD